MSVGGNITPIVDDSTVLGTTLLSFAGIYSHFYGTTSDARKKENVVDLALSLSFINRLRPVEFDYTSDEAHKKYVGLIAQEVDAAISDEGYAYPEVIVAYDADNDIYAIDHTKIVAPLIKAVQMLSAQNDALQARIAVLESIP